MKLQNENCSSSYAFFDSHGRNDNGSYPGSKSAILFFENKYVFLDFFLKENHLISPFNSVNYDSASNIIIVPLHFVDVTEEENINSQSFNNKSTLFTKVISGRFSQND